MLLLVAHRLQVRIQLLHRHHKAALLQRVGQVLLGIHVEAPFRGVHVRVMSGLEEASILLWCCGVMPWGGGIWVEESLFSETS